MAYFKTPEARHAYNQARNQARRAARQQTQLSAGPEAEADDDALVLEMPEVPAAAEDVPTTPLGETFEALDALIAPSTPIAQPFAPVPAAIMGVPLYVRPAVLEALMDAQAMLRRDAQLRRDLELYLQKVQRSSTGVLTDVLAALVETR